MKCSNEIFRFVFQLKSNTSRGKNEEGHSSSTSGPDDDDNDEKDDDDSPLT